MDIFEIDKNFCFDEVDEPDIEFVSAKDIVGALYGVYYDETSSIYRRMPDDIAKDVSEGVRYNARCTAGGRLRIETNSPYIALKVVEPKEKVASSMSPTVQFGFAIEENNLYQGDVAPLLWSEYVEKKDSQFFSFQGIRYLGPEEKMHPLTIYFPSYNAVNELFVGVKKGCVLKKGKDYKYKMPIVFYGSSIEQGASASRSGTDYISTVCKWLDSDYINMGFSGACMAERQMAKYIASLSASVYVLAYDHNAPDIEYYEKTHYDLYKIIRDKNKKTPILLTTRPNVTADVYFYGGKRREYSTQYSLSKECDANRRRTVAWQTYIKAKNEGDENIFFFGGDGLFGNENCEMNSSDFTHPNDLGFYKMAKAIYPILKDILEKT